MGGGHTQRAETDGLNQEKVGPGAWGGDGCSLPGQKSRQNLTKLSSLQPGFIEQETSAPT